jgi:TRAP-type C4-dicarboxylate transport system substrate-binding protein
MMKRLTCLLVILVLLVGVTSVALAEKKPIKLKAVHFLRQGDQSLKIFNLFVDSVNKAAKGELFIEIQGGPESIPGRQQPEAVRNGFVDLCFVPCAWYKAICPPAAVMGLSRLEPAKGRKSGLHDFLSEEHKKVGLRFIGSNGTSNKFWMYAKKPIKSPDELKGLRFRHSPTYTFFKGIGLIPISARLSDIYSGLDRNLFVGLATKHSSFIHFSLYEVCKYVIGPGFWPYYSVATIMNESKFDQLPKHLQELILGAEEKLEQRIIELTSPLIDKLWKKLEQEGVKRVQWSAEDSKMYLDKIDQITWEIRGKKLPPGMADKMKKMMGY